MRSIQCVDTLTRADRLITGPQIDADLQICSRTRSNWILQKKLPAPDCYINGRPRWRLASFLAYKARLMAGPSGTGTCGICGNLFPRGREDQLFCSSKCRTRAWRVRRSVSTASHSHSDEYREVSQ